MLDQSSNDLSLAVLQTVAYSDIFDYPLTAREIHQYLTGVKASLEEVISVLGEENGVTRTGDYFTLPGRDDIVSVRTRREAYSRELLPHAFQYGRMLGSLPYVRMVALTGSLAVMNVSKNQDFDYMLVTTSGRVWTARAFVLAFNRLARLQGHTLCPNLIISETALEWPLHDLYSARELYQMIPIAGMDVYHRLLTANAWAQNFLPNTFNTNGLNFTKSVKKGKVLSRRSPFSRIRIKNLQYLLEIPLRGRLGERFEQWEMNRKITRFSKQAGFGEETIFNAEVCQGNFHHHRKWTRELFEKRLSALADVSGGEVALTQSSGSAIGANRL